jgi:ferrochelatase
MKIDHVLIIGYGSPSKKEDVSPYLKRLAETNRIPESRMAEVADHYEAIGGTSPYNEEIAAFARNLQTVVMGNGAALPIYVGMKNWQPFLEDIIPTIRAKGHQAGLAIVMAPHRSFASFDAYVHCVSRICGESEPGGFHQYRYLDAWHRHPLFVKAHAEEIRKAAALLRVETVERGPLIFSAHSIPLAMPGCAQYEREVRESAEDIAAACGYRHWQIAWQSRSGRPDQPWLGPDVNSAIRQLKEEGNGSPIFVPLGFVCDNAEVLYDLDIDARAQTKRHGFQYVRAKTVIHHPSFLEMFSELIRSAVSRE